MHTVDQIHNARREGYHAGWAFHLEGAARPTNPYDERINAATEISGEDYANLVKLAEAWQDGFELAGEES